MPLLPPRVPRTPLAHLFSAQGKRVRYTILILYGLLLSGQIRFRKIDGWQTLVQVVADRKEELKKRAS